MCFEKNKKIIINSKANFYSVIFTRSTFLEIAKCLAICTKKVAIVTDSNIANIYLENFACALKEQNVEVIELIFKAGEESKTITTYSKFLNILANNHSTRDTYLIALGGGISIDICGFLAATYLRGVKYISVPTSLLAMADVSVGGKTGVNLEQGKNLVGTFYNPAKVFINKDFLNTLPSLEFLNGLSEITKHAIINGGELLIILETLHSKNIKPKDWPIEDIIYNSINIKAAIITNDEFEYGKRAWLNYGHTVGHGIEKASNHKIPHGIAIAFGMRAEAFISQKLGLLNKEAFYRIINLIDLGCFQKELLDISKKDIYKYMFSDKKNKNGNIMFSLPISIGKMYSNNNKHTISANESIINESLDLICSV